MLHAPKIVQVHYVIMCYYEVLLVQYLVFYHILLKQVNNFNWMHIIQIIICMHFLDKGNHNNNNNNNTNKIRRRIRIIMTTMIVYNYSNI